MLRSCSVAPVRRPVPQPPAAVRCPVADRLLCQTISMTAIFSDEQAPRGRPIRDQPAKIDWE